MILCNSANYNSSSDWGGIDGNVTTVGTNGGPSYYGTYDQSGLLYELTDELSGSQRIISGGSRFDNIANNLSKYYRTGVSPGTASSMIGFRVASSALLSDSLLSWSLVTYDINSNITDSDTSNLYGAVAYDYKISTYLVTNSIYAQFLNSIAKTDSYSLYTLSMSGIIRSGTNGRYTYSIATNMGNKPVTFVTWFRAARFCNWLHNNKPETGAQLSTTTESGAYDINGSNLGINFTKNSGANFWIPSMSEWYKAAFFDPTLNGNTGGFWKFATQSNSDPIPVSASASGDGQLPIVCISPTPTASPTYTPTSTPTSTPTPTPTNTTTPTNTPSNTPTQTPTVSITPSSSPTSTPTTTPSVTPTISLTPSITPSSSQTPTPTPTITLTSTPSPTPTSTPSPTPTLTPTPTSSPCPLAYVGQLIFDNSVFNGEEISVLYKDYKFDGIIVDPMTDIRVDPNFVSPTPTSSNTPTPTPTGV